MCVVREKLRNPDIPDATLRFTALQQRTEKVSGSYLSFSFMQILFQLYLIFSEFSVCLPKKRCPQCKSSFDTETKLLMHLGCTHREVHKYLPSKAKDLMPGVRNGASPTKVVKTPAPKTASAPATDLFQKFASNVASTKG